MVDCHEKFILYFNKPRNRKRSKVCVCVCVSVCVRERALDYNIDLVYQPGE